MAKVSKNEMVDVVVRGIKEERNFSEDKKAAETWDHVSKFDWQDCLFTCSLQRLCFQSLTGTQVDQEGRRGDRPHVSTGSNRQTSKSKKSNCGTPVLGVEPRARE